MCTYIIMEFVFTCEDPAIASDFQTYNLFENTE
jgi:hypothetical protein